MGVKKRNPIISLLLSVIAPGLGQIYNGQLKKGIFLYGTGIFLLLIRYFACSTFYGLLIWWLLFLPLYPYIILNALLFSLKTKVINLKLYNKWYIYLLCIPIMNGIFFRTLFLNLNFGPKAYSIVSQSMLPALQPGDLLIVNCVYGFRNSKTLTLETWTPESKPKRGDVIVYAFPPDPSKDYLHRIIGLPGERIQIINKKVYIDGKLMETPGAVSDDPAIIPAPDGPGGSPRDNLGPVVVPANAYFVMGDNRDHSFDSRFWGVVPLKSIIGKASYIYFSRDPQSHQIHWTRFGKNIN
jgi:signal peptidase I